MNCKPGDLAVVVNGNSAGLLVDVVREHPIDLTRWICRVHAACRLKNGQIKQAGELATCKDSRLRPIRDPGEDAQDEALSWLPVPSTEKEAA